MKKLTMEEFMQRALEKNEHVRNGDIEIIGKYNGIYEQLEYICRKCNTSQAPIALSLLIGNGCQTCGKKQSGVTQRKAHEDFVDELRTINNKIIPVEQYVTRNTKITFVCELGHMWKTTPGNVLSGKGCPYCSGRKVLVGFNDIATTNSWMLEYLANPEDGYRYTQGSNIRIDFKCPTCGYIQNRKICTVSYKGFHCERCGDNISYPNKFGRAFFDQLPLTQYQAEYRPDWGRPYIYDIYFQLEGKEYIVEWDGGQHFEDRGAFGMALEEHRVIDGMKNKLARDNNVCLIRINCAESRCDYIRYHIENSKLSTLFDLSDIDWVLCDKNAQKNLVKMVCDLWTSGIHSFEHLSKMLHLGNSTVRDYINRGTCLGWCDYDPRQWIEKQCIPIYVTDVASNKQYFFKSLRECADGTVDISDHRIAEETIRKYCKKGIPYNGLIFSCEPFTIQN